MTHSASFHRSYDLADLYFAVEQAASETLFPGFQFVQDQERVIYLPASKKVLHFCSKGYRLVPNRQIMEPIHDALTQRYGEAGFDTQVQHFDHRKFYVSFVVRAVEWEIAPGDVLHPSLEIRNSYDGSLKFSLARGCFRPRSTAHLMAFDEPVAGEKKHSQRHGPRPSVKAIDALEKKESLLATLQALHAVRLDPAQVTAWAGEVLQQTPYPRRLITDAAHQLYAESDAWGSPLSAWLFYCAFNEILYRADISMHPEFRARIDAGLLAWIQRKVLEG